MRAALLILAALILGAAEAKRSGYDDAGAATRAMQDDDSANPGFLWVLQGEALWSRPDGREGRSCASCHPAETMAGVAARYPRVTDRVVTLADQVRQCRVERQGAPDPGPDDEVMLALTAWIGFQARGAVITVPDGAREQPFLRAGREIFETRMGQFNLSCAQCHDALAGQRLAGSVIPEGHPNGYPLYRLEWQALGSLYRRLRNCMTGVRAEPFAWDSAERRALELYLYWRASGLRVETPAVRP